MGWLLTVSASTTEGWKMRGERKEKVFFLSDCLNDKMSINRLIL